MARVVFSLIAKKAGKEQGTRGKEHGARFEELRM